MELIVSTARAEDEVVDLGTLGSSDPKWNPYQFDRAPTLIGIPALILLAVLIHTFRRKKRFPLDRERAERYFND